MKKILTGFAGILLIGAIIWTCNFLGCYTKEGTVIKAQAGVITIEDCTGQLWVYETKEFKKGDDVILHLNINGTDTYFEDDFIEKIEIQ